VGLTFRAVLRILSPSTGEGACAGGARAACGQGHSYAQAPAAPPEGGMFGASFDERSGEGSAPMARPGAVRRLCVVHVTTVPETLQFLNGQAAFLRERGVEMRAITSPGPALDVFAAAEQVECFGVPMERRFAPLHDLVAVVQLWRLLRALRPDVVDAHTPKGGLLGMAAAWLAGVPIRIYHLHGLRLETSRGARRAIMRTAERFTATLAHRVLCVSQSVAAAAAGEGVVAPGRARVLGAGSINGVDATRFRPADRESRRAARAALGLPPDARVIGFVGRLGRDKGIAELAAAWGTIREQLPDVRLLLVGPDEPNDPPPPGVIPALRSDPRVLAPGVDWDTPKYYRAMDIVALPTYREGFPVVPLEAAAMGLPVVATRVTGCVDAVVDGVTGTLVAPRDAAALAAALRAYLADPALRARHGEAGRARALRDFEPRAIWEALHAEYLALVRAASGAAAREPEAT
jgi:glycosyltransferase involved in cell wall biosynthesis